MKSTAFHVVIPLDAQIIIKIKKNEDKEKNKPIQDGGEAKAPLWLNRLSVTN